jgi:hypothetical protein
MKGTSPCPPRLIIPWWLMGAERARGEGMGQAAWSPRPVQRLKASVPDGAASMRLAQAPIRGCGQRPSVTNRLCQLNAIAVWVEHVHEPHLPGELQDDADVHVLAA